MIRILITTQFLCWGPNIVSLVGQSLSTSSGTQTSLIDIAALHFGAGRHVDLLGHDDLFGYFKVLYAFEFLYALAMSFVKYSMYGPFYLPPRGL